MRLFKWILCQLIGHRPFLALPKGHGGEDWILRRTDWGTGAFVNVYVCARCGAMYAKFGVTEIEDSRLQPARAAGGGA